MQKMVKKPVFGAVLLSGGKGKRMNNKIAKQYLLLQDKPILYYSLFELEQSDIEKIVIVVAKGEVDTVKKDIIDRYGFRKVVDVVEGGEERYHSVYQGLVALSNIDCVMIHDGARPFIDQDMLGRLMKQVQIDQACVVGMPVKDTIKIVDKEGFVVTTPQREDVWMVQTPQVFDYTLVKNAYDLLMQEKRITVTDDAMVVEKMTGHVVRLVEGSYRNIKITTPEDLVLANVYLQGE